MLKLDKVSVMNLENAMRGARNPMNSWERSDSNWVNIAGDMFYVLGPNDLDLAKRLCKAGSDHRKLLRQIFVSVDITAPMTWWMQYDTYKVGTTCNSTSKMHTIHKRPFELSDFSADSFKCVKQEVVEITTDNEEWKKIEGLKYHYVSNNGKVKCVEHCIKRKDGVCLNIPERFISVTVDDYLVCTIREDGKRYKLKLHRLMAEAFIENENNLKVVNHKDGNKLNCNLNNLEWCTHSQNTKHAHDNGLIKFKKESKDKISIMSRKLTFEEAEKVREERIAGAKIEQLSEKYNVSVSSISRIINNKLYVKDNSTEYDFYLEVVERLNCIREKYLITNDKKYWRMMIDLLPSSYNQTRTCTMTYENLWNMYNARKSHKLTEWHTFCEWVEGLPYMKEFMGIGEQE